MPTASTGFSSAKRSDRSPHLESISGARTRPGPEGDVGLPRFLQRKCAACAAGETLCPECEEEQAKMQMAATAGGSTSPHPRQIHVAAREGVRGADKALPHLDKVQASFGRHDVSHARARTGGAAARASARMGAEAYTVGN